MPQPKPTYAVVYSNTGPTLLGRIINNDGTYIEQADIDEISLVVTDESDPSEPVAEADLDVEDVVYDELQTDERWTADSVGYNFAYPMLASQLPSAGSYRVDIKFTPIEGQQFFAVWKLRAEKTYG